MRDGRDDGVHGAGPAGGFVHVGYEGVGPHSPPRRRKPGRHVWERRGSRALQRRRGQPSAGHRHRPERQDPRRRASCGEGEGQAHQGPSRAPAPQHERLVGHVLRERRNRGHGQDVRDVARPGGHEQRLRDPRCRGGERDRNDLRRRQGQEGRRQHLEQHGVRRASLR